MSLDTKMVSIHPHFTIKDGKMDQCIALLEEILVLTKANEPDCLFFNITTCGSAKAYVREAYKDGAAALFHLKNMGHMIPKLFEVSDINEFYAEYVPSLSLLALANTISSTTFSIM